MSAVKIAIPLWKGKRRFFIAKGRPWSVVEHVFLASLVHAPRTVDELSTQADMPRRLVLESLIRLMRAGWVDISQEPHGIIFSASTLGSEVVSDEELPQVSKTTSRWMNFVIDRLTGTLYRSRELPFLEKRIVEQRAFRERLVWLEPRSVDALHDTSGMLSTLFNDDEKFLGIEPSGERMVERYAVITVRNGVIEGLPTRAPDELSSLILEAATKAQPNPEGALSPKFLPAPAPPLESKAPQQYQSTIKISDIILGGEKHQEAFYDAIKKSRNRIIIHSTFISEDRFNAVLPLLIEAAKRGVIIDVLWGEDDDKTESKSTPKIVSRLRDSVEKEGFSSSLRIHTFSTRSHAKILIHDDGKSSRFSATLGSCNWLSSGFQTYEASIRFSDPYIVSKIMEKVTDLSRGYDGHWTELANEFAKLAVEIRSQKPQPGSKAKVSLVLGAQHAFFMRKARDSAKERIFITSHRLGSATKAAVVVPAVAAVQDRAIKVDAYYGISSGNVDDSLAAQITEEAKSDGINIHPTISPRLHAKILAWDNDNLLITSQNWLSADPSTSTPLREIGIFVESKNIASHVIENFMNCQHPIKVEK